MPRGAWTLLAGLAEPDRAGKTANYRDKAEKRLWRVLYYHVKAIFEATDTGVLEFRELDLPYIVVPKTNQTVGKQLLAGSVGQMLVSSAQRLLAAEN